MRLRASIGVWLLVLSMVASLPLFLVAAYLIYTLAQEQQHSELSELAMRTQASADAVQQRLGTALGYLNALAASDAARQNDLRALYEHARRVTQLDPDARAFSLVAADNQLVFLTLRPYGESSWVGGDMEAARQVFETGKPAVSGPFKSPVSDAVVTTVGVPIVQVGKVVYCLRMVLLTSTLNNVLANQKLPIDWTISIVDKTGLVVARSRSPERFIGQQISAGIAAAVKANKLGLVETTTLEGVPSLAYVANMPAWDWYVAVSLPSASLDKAKTHSLRILAAVALLVTGLSTILSLRLAHYIRGHIKEVGAAANALRNERDAPRLANPIDELHEIAQTFDVVTQREERTKLALLSIKTQHEQIASELDAARRDTLTGLPGRGLFLDTVEVLRKALAAQGGRNLALLLIDLDGFKSVNDQYGHERGDTILVQTADILRSLTRGSDVSARFGGDEFVVCLTATEDQADASAQRVAERIVEQVAGIGFGIACSVGIAFFSEKCPDLSCAMRRADEAMYEAKRRGKNQYVVYGVGSKVDHTNWTTPVPQQCKEQCGA